ncbi:htpb, partial [Metamycoplasma hominis]
MNEEINKLKINIDEFKQNFWYAKAFEIPYHVKRINPKISEDQFFEILSKDIYLLCDLFIDQK